MDTSSQVVAACDGLIGDNSCDELLIFHQTADRHDVDWEFHTGGPVERGGFLDLLSGAFITIDDVFELAVRGQI